MDYRRGYQYAEGLDQTKIVSVYLERIQLAKGNKNFVLSRNRQKNPKSRIIWMYNLAPKMQV